MRRWLARILGVSPCVHCMKVKEIAAELEEQKETIDGVEMSSMDTLMLLGKLFPNESFTDRDLDTAIRAYAIGKRQRKEQREDPPRV